MKEKKLYDNIHIITNNFEWDEEGNAVSVRKPIIHSMNKDETSIKKYPAYNLIKDRRNVLLLGDKIGDIGMVNGFDYGCLIKIGFLNDKVEERLIVYRNFFDIIILNDSSMKYVNRLLHELFK